VTLPLCCIDRIAQSQPDTTLTHGKRGFDQFEPVRSGSKPNPAFRPPEVAENNDFAGVNVSDV